MTDVERDLGTKLDWVAVDHWNTDNPHVHVLIRGRAEDGQDLVISRDYISRGFRDRAAERVTLELGPRSEQEIRSALEREVEAERWTEPRPGAARSPPTRAPASPTCGQGSGEDPELRRLMVGRAAKLERLGLADQVAPGCWTLKPGIEDDAARSRDPRRHHQDDASGDGRRRPRAGCLRLCPAWRGAGRSRARPPGRARAA